METIKNSILAAVGTAIAAIAAWLGKKINKRVERWLNTKEKKSVAKTVVMATEQMYRDLDGEAKLEKALEAASDMLAEKGITITALELRMLIEEAVGEFNDAFNKEKKAESELDNRNVDLDNAEQLYGICDDDGCGIDYPDTILSVDELCGVQDTCDDSTASDEEDTSANEGLSEFGDYDS